MCVEKPRLDGGADRQSVTTTRRVSGFHVERHLSFPSVILSRHARRLQTLPTPITPLPSLFHLNSIRNEFLGIMACVTRRLGGGLRGQMRRERTDLSSLLRYTDQGWRYLCASNLFLSVLSSSGGAKVAVRYSRPSTSGFCN